MFYFTHKHAHFFSECTSSVSYPCVQLLNSSVFFFFNDSCSKCWDCDLTPRQGPWTFQTCFMTKVSQRVPYSSYRLVVTYTSLLPCATCSLIYHSPSGSSRSVKLYMYTISRGGGGGDKLNLYGPCWSSHTFFMSERRLVVWTAFASVSRF